MDASESNGDALVARVREEALACLAQNYPAVRSANSDGATPLSWPDLVAARAPRVIGIWKAMETVCEREQSDLLPILTAHVCISQWWIPRMFDTGGGPMGRYQSHWSNTFVNSLLREFQRVLPVAAAQSSAVGAPKSAAQVYNGRGGGYSLSGPVTPIYCNSTTNTVANSRGLAAYLGGAAQTADNTFTGAAHTAGKSLAPSARANNCAPVAVAGAAQSTVDSVVPLTRVGAPTNDSVPTNGSSNVAGAIRAPIATSIAGASQTAGRAQPTRNSSSADARQRESRPTEPPPSQLFASSSSGTGRNVVVAASSYALGVAASSAVGSVSDVQRVLPQKRSMPLIAASPRSSAPLSTGYTNTGDRSYNNTDSASTVGRGDPRLTANARMQVDEHDDEHRRNAHAGKRAASAISAATSDTTSREANLQRGCSGGSGGGVSGGGGAAGAQIKRARTQRERLLEIRLRVERVYPLFNDRNLWVDESGTTKAARLVERTLLDLWANANRALTAMPTTVDAARVAATSSTTSTAGSGGSVSGGVSRAGQSSAISRSAAGATAGATAGQRKMEPIKDQQKLADAINGRRKARDRDRAGNNQVDQCDCKPGHHGVDCTNLWLAYGRPTISGLERARAGKAEIAHLLREIDSLQHVPKLRLFIPTRPISKMPTEDSDRRRDFWNAFDANHLNIIAEWHHGRAVDAEKDADEVHHHIAVNTLEPDDLSAHQRLEDAVFAALDAFNSGHASGSDLQAALIGALVDTNCLVRALRLDASGQHVAAIRLVAFMGEIVFLLHTGYPTKSR